MSDNDKIEASHFMKLVCLFIIGTSSIVIPTIMASQAKQDAWISSIVGMAAGVLLVLLYSALGRLYPGKDLVEISKEAFGKWLGSLVSLLWFLYAFILSSLALRSLGEFLKSTMIPETPVEAIFIVYLCIVVIGVRYGISNIARTVDVFFPWVIGLVILFAVMLVPDIEISRLEPVYGEGIQSILKGAYPHIAFPYLELILLLIVYPKVKHSKAAGRAFLRGTLLGGSVITLVTGLSILVLGAESTASDIFSSFELAKEIEIGGFIQRVEVIIAAIWFITIFFKLVLVFYITVLSLSQTLNLSEYRTISLPLGLLFYASGVLIAPNISNLMTFHINIRPAYSAIIGFVLPATVLGVGIIRKRFRTARS
ncbi:endospore germination permease [Paenibacillus sp. sptzw28]|uniref:GerAB/ArcD/ProY family transporter n=1 Tax=Paenibacillus sp. sptzw28 TaxID=715179 RepID=UPI001C6E0F36|nr:endospore germination permease [Paenibacillus sp. sptzw28]QYR22793.1 endospore germination permease [Paenibacillus sp. sptzw28]